MVISTCPTSEYSNRTEQPLEFGVLGFYYDLGFRLMRTVIDTADGRFAKQISNLYYNSSTTLNVLKKDVFFNITLTVVIIISLLLALSFWVASILSCGKNIVTGKRSSGTDTLVLAFSSLTMCICVTSLAVYCFTSSVNVIRNGHVTALVDIERAYESVNNFVADSANTTLCMFDERRPNLEQTFASMVVNTSKKLDDFRERFACRNIETVFASKKKLLETLRELENLTGKPISQDFTKIASANRKTQTVLGTLNISRSDATAGVNFLNVLEEGLSAMAKHYRNGEIRMNSDLDSYRLLINDVNTNRQLRGSPKPSRSTCRDVIKLCVGYRFCIDTLTSQLTLSKTLN
ncbi:hypothetical protein Y032_0103g3538 [Ancylostoma ceylanicum]|uniref:Uncharacterized protein n=1 Tax=Ancylostoma ceylanicum TaxID=53326 RepID=A0A016TG11_9BILA|nr:hypothetical protein Y032_0103g3538 [Ancylostoma ceylanicum]